MFPASRLNVVTVIPPKNRAGTTFISLKLDLPTDGKMILK